MATRDFDRQHNPGPFGWCCYYHTEVENWGSIQRYQPATPVESDALPSQETGLIVDPPAPVPIHSQAGLSPSALSKFRDTLLAEGGLEDWMNRQSIVDLSELSERIPHINTRSLSWVWRSALPPTDALAEIGFTEDRFLDTIAYGLGIFEEDVIAEWNAGRRMAAREGTEEEADDDDWTPQWDSIEDDDSDNPGT